MQLMPETAFDYGVTDRCDPEENIRAGVRYLKKLYGEFDDPLLMLAAYNAGPERVYGRHSRVQRDRPVHRQGDEPLDAERQGVSGAGKAQRKPPPETVALAPSPWRDQHVWTAE